MGCECTRLRAPTSWFQAPQASSVSCCLQRRKITFIFKIQSSIMASTAHPWSSYKGIGHLQCPQGALLQQCGQHPPCVQVTQGITEKLRKSNVGAHIANTDKNGYGNKYMWFDVTRWWSYVALIIFSWCLIVFMKFLSIGNSELTTIMKYDWEEPF